MKRLLSAALACLLFCAPALAGTKTPLGNYGGGALPIKSTDTLQTSAPTTANASINLPHGTAPTSPNNGDCWTTTAGLYCQINGATVGPLGTGGGGGSSVGALTLIQSQTLSANAASVSFNSIPQGYQDLELVITGRGDNASATIDPQITLNGDSTTNHYISIYQGANSGGAFQGSNFAANMDLGPLPGASAPSNYSGTLSFALRNYAGTTFFKTGYESGGDASSSSPAGQVQHVVLQWLSTAAVTNLTISASAGNFVAGSTFQLYGRGGNVTVNPAPGLPVIQEVVTSGSQASVTISSIPQTYRDLMVVVSGRTTSANGVVNLQAQFNADTGSNYDTQYLQANSTTIAGSQSIATTSINVGLITAASAGANQSGGTSFRIHDYASTTFYKLTVANSGADGGSGVFYDGQMVGQWKNTAAINSLTVFPSTGNFTDGTKVTVYGIGGSPTATLPVAPPQGRLTLTSNTPVMTADATAQTTIYYTPYVGTLIPIGNVMYRFSQISYALNTTAHASGSLYDVFAYNNAGALALCTGPAWTNSTTRSAAIQMDAVNGIWENTSSLTCNLTGSTTTTTIAAAQATYLGTFYATAAGQTGMSFNPAATAGGTNNFLALYNAYNRVRIVAQSRDATANWTYNLNTWRVTDPGATGSGLNNRITIVDGLQQSPIQAVATVGLGSIGYYGVNLDSTSATPSPTAGNIASSVTQAYVRSSFAPQLGLHYLQGMEATGDGGTGSTNFDGLQNSNQMQAISVTLDM